MQIGGQQGQDDDAICKDDCADEVVVVVWVFDKARTEGADGWPVWVVCRRRGANAGHILGVVECDCVGADLTGAQLRHAVDRYRTCNCAPLHARKYRIGLWVGRPCTLSHFLFCGEVEFCNVTSVPQRIAMLRRAANAHARSVLAMLHCVTGTWLLAHASAASNDSADHVMTGG